MMKNVAAILWLALPLIGLAQSSASYDAVIVGATPAGISAAVNAAREGLSAVIVDEHDRIGGL